MGLLIIQIIIVIILLVIIIYMIRQNIALSYEKRISNYSIDSLKSKEMSLSDKLFLKYKKLVIKFRPFISKVGLFKFLSKKYEKYIVYTNDKDNILAIDYVTHKLFIGLALVLLTIFSLVLQTRLATLFGFFILDIYLWYKDRLYKKRIDNELLRAVIVINNAFKSGKSTMQSLEAASYDLPEPIRSEFYKMYQEMKYGLGIETVFDRFSKRIDLEEIKYISSSLAILNKTGGNIIKVFDSIEKTLFDKKKLKEELKNMTASSNLVVKLLMVVPLIFVLVIYILNPSYFDPFFETNLGLVLLGLIVIMFAIYIWVLQKILKVKV
mgnify:CR=1 FL=1